MPAATVLYQRTVHHERLLLKHLRPSWWKKYKMQSWMKFGHQPGSYYWQANKVFWQTIWRLRGKRSNIAKHIKDQNGVLLIRGEDILRKWIEYFKIVSFQSLSRHRTHTRYRRNVTLLLPKSSLLSAQRRLGRLQTAMKCDLKCSKPRIKKGFFGWLVCVRWPGVLEGHRRIGKMERSSPYTRRGQEWMH